MKLYSITYRFQVEGEWEPIAKRYSRTIRYTPDRLAFDVHVNARDGVIRIGNIAVMGCRLLKDDKPGASIREQFYNYNDAPEFAKNYFDEALRDVRASQDS